MPNRPRGRSWDNPRAVPSWSDFDPERPPPVQAGSTRFKSQPDKPDPQSQSFSRSYGSILPTSLTYIVLSTRGCSPWRPAAVMSTTGRENQSLPRVFKGRRERTGHHKKCGALPSIEPYLRPIRFQGDGSLKRKENSSQGSRQRPRVRLRYRTCRKTAISAFRFGNINPIPFRCTARNRAL